MDYNVALKGNKMSNFGIAKQKMRKLKRGVRRTPLRLHLSVVWIETWQVAFKIKYDSSDMKYKMRGPHLRKDFTDQNILTSPESCSITKERITSLLENDAFSKGTIIKSPDVGLKSDLISDGEWEKTKRQKASGVLGEAKTIVWYKSGFRAYFQPRTR
ncbi:hypothetical protein LXL04_035121 [Taraxacum kok-saghyz]